MQDTRLKLYICFLFIPPYEAQVPPWWRLWLAKVHLKPCHLKTLSRGCAGHQSLSSSTAKKWGLFCSERSPSSSQTGIYLKGALCCITGTKENQLAVPHWLWKVPLILTAFVAESGGKKKRESFLPATMPSSQGGLEEAHYQAGVTECGEPAAHPVSNGTETSTLLPLFSSGSSRDLRGLLILAYNGKCVAVLNLKPLFTTLRSEGSRSLCLIYTQCLRETLRAEERLRKNPCGIRKRALMHVTRWF